MDGTKPGHHRRSDHLSHRLRADLHAARQSRAGLHRFRELVRLRHLSGRHGHLLGAQPRRRVPAGHPWAATRRNQSGDRAGCDWRGLGLRVRARRRNRPAQFGRAPRVPRLVSAVLACLGSRRRRSRESRRLRQAVPSERRPQQAGGLQHRNQGRRVSHQSEQQRRGRPAAGVFRARVHGPWARLLEVARRHRERLTGRRSARDADSRTGRGKRSART